MLSLGLCPEEFKEQNPSMADFPNSTFWLCSQWKTGNETSNPGVFSASLREYSCCWVVSTSAAASRSIWSLYRVSVRSGYWCCCRRWERHHMINVPLEDRALGIKSTYSSKAWTKHWTRQCFFCGTDKRGTLCTVLSTFLGSSQGNIKLCLLDDETVPVLAQELTLSVARACVKLRSCTATYCEPTAGLLWENPLVSWTIVVWKSRINKDTTLSRTQSACYFP